MRLFFSQSPAFYYALFAAFGIWLGFLDQIESIVYLLPFMILLLCLQIKKALFGVGTTLFFYLFAVYTVTLPNLPQKVQGEGTFHIEQFGSKNTSYGKQWTYKGKLLEFS